MNWKFLLLAMVVIAMGLGFSMDMGTYYDDDYYYDDYDYGSSTSCCCTGIVLPFGLILGGYLFTRRL